MSNVRGRRTFMAPLDRRNLSIITDSQTHYTANGVNITNKHHDTMVRVNISRKRRTRWTFFAFSTPFSDAYRGICHVVFVMSFSDFPSRFPFYFKFSSLFHNLIFSYSFSEIIFFQKTLLLCIFSFSDIFCFLFFFYIISILFLPFQTLIINK